MNVVVTIRKEKTDAEQKQHRPSREFGTAFLRTLATIEKKKESIDNK